MSDRRDLELVLESGTPLIVIETTDETRVLELLREIAVSRSAAYYRPLFRWSITDGIQRLDLSYAPGLVPDERSNGQGSYRMGRSFLRRNPGKLRIVCR